MSVCHIDFSCLSWFVVGYLWTLQQGQEQIVAISLVQDESFTGCQFIEKKIDRTVQHVDPDLLRPI
jgi:hypothetical protein